jgi:glucose/arabinose dehydrogenase
MTRKKHIRNIAIISLIALAGGVWYLMTPDKARLDLAQVQGQLPKIDTPRPEAFPSINIAEIVGWQGNAMPKPAAGLAVNAFANKLDHPRWLYELPNGDVLVAESTQPLREPSGMGDRIAKWIIRRANGTSVSANRIALLRDADGDGVAEFRSVLLSGLNSPFGMVLVGGTLYVGNTDNVMAFPYKDGDTTITAKGTKLVDLPANAPNNHWTRNVIADPAGEHLYITVGSNSNIAEGGMKAEEGRAQIHQYNLKTKQFRTFAYGLRNPTGLAFNPVSQSLWTTVNERDMLGSDGPPDYMTTVDFGTFYGWPYSYWGNEDQRVLQDRPDLKQYTKRPDYALGPHVAALGLAFNTGDGLGSKFRNGAFVGLHGSWNRYPASGYSVVYVPFNDRGFPVTGAKPVEVLSGFLNADGDAQGRPAGVLFDKKGALLVADDSGNTIWRVTEKAKPPQVASIGRK